MNVALAKNETGRALSDSFAIVRDRLPGTGKVAAARSTAFDAYAQAGLPHRVEDDGRVAMRLDARRARPRDTFEHTGRDRHVGIGDEAAE